MNGEFYNSLFLRSLSLPLQQTHLRFFIYFLEIFCIQPCFVPQNFCTRNHYYLPPPLVFLVHYSLPQVFGTNGTCIFHMSGNIAHIVSVGYCFWLFMTIHILTLPSWFMFKAKELDPLYIALGHIFFQTNTEIKPFPFVVSSYLFSAGVTAYLS